MKKKEEEQSVKPPKYTQEELAYRSRITREIDRAYDQRKQRYTELDDMTYDEYYISNAKAAAAYIPPKVNVHDVRTVSGTTREKCNTLLSSLLNNNLEHDVEAFDDQDMPMKELGTIMEDLIRKSRKIELPDYDTKRPLIYQELIQQGTVFVLEKQCEYGLISKKLKKEGITNYMTAKWTERLEKVEKYLDSELVPGLNVYLGNIREFYIEKQPYIAIRRQITRAEAKSLYGDWERWENVPYQVTHVAPAANTATTISGTSYNSWVMIETAQDLVEEVKYFNKWLNEYQILLNGEMMLPIGFPLEFMLGVNEYPIAKGDIEPIAPFFAYSRAIPAKTKVNQSIMDEMMKAIILKTRKSYNPPIANNSGVTLSPKINYPGTVHDNIDPMKIQEIGNNTGVTSSEFSALEFIKNIVDESSVSPVFEGNASKGQQTAREVVELKQQSMMKLGLTLFGVINLEKKLGWLRLFSILHNWTDPVDKRLVEIRGEIQERNVYKNVTVDSEFEDGQKGKRVIEFTDQELPHPAQVGAEAEVLSKRKGMKVHKVYINAQDLKTVQYNWFITVNPTSKDTNELRAAMFDESLTNAKQLFPNQVNDEEAKRRWAILHKENPDKFFVQAPQGMPGMPPGAQPQGGPLQAQAMQGAQQQMPKPTLNTLAQA